MTTQLLISPGRRGTALYDTPYSDTNQEVVLDADDVQSVSVPADAKFVWVISTGDFYSATETFTLPSGNTFSSGVSQLNPPNPKNVEGVTTLFFRSRLSQEITVAFYT